jgi:site-specific DNA-methyltransferase (adenine-specific)
MEEIDLRLGDCLEVMQTIPDKTIDLTVTSPPYDNLRTYNGYTFDFEGIAKQLYRVTKDGGVLVWVVGDATINGSETGTSFRQALYFKDIGFNLHDTMIYEKVNPLPTGKSRYYQAFEYMFVLSKGKPKTFNPLLQEAKDYRPNGKKGTSRQANGDLFNYEYKTNKEVIKRNIFQYKIGLYNTTSDKYAFEHPAMFPEQLAYDHIISWSNEGDTVLDCFLGSGTTGKVTKQLNRKFIGIEISQEYLSIAKQRLANG